jgi:hypothetical protein
MAEQENEKPASALTAIGDALKASETRDKAVERIGEGFDAIKGGVEIGKTMRELPPVKVATEYQAGVQELSEKSGHQDRTGLENAFKKAETDAISRYAMLEAGNAMASQGMQVKSAGELAELSLVLTRYAESKSVSKEDSAKLMAALYKSGTTDPKAMADAMARISQLAQQARVGQNELAKALPELLAKQQPGKEALPAAAIAALAETKGIGQDAAAAEWANVRIADGGGAEDLRFKHRAHVERSGKTSKELWQEADAASNRAMGNIGDALRPVSDGMAKALAGAASGLASFAAQAPGAVVALGTLGATAAAAVAAFKILRGGKQIVGGLVDYVSGFGKGGEQESTGGVQDVRVTNWHEAGKASGGRHGGGKRRKRGKAPAKQRGPDKPAARPGRDTGAGTKQRVRPAGDVPGRGQTGRTPGRAVATLTKFGGLLQKVPAIGAGLRLAATVPTLLGSGSRQEKLEAASGASGAVAGTFVGGAIGGTIGALLGGPIGLPIGKAVGGFVGGLVGEAVGRKLVAQGQASGRKETGGVAMSAPSNVAAPAAVSAGTAAAAANARAGNSQFNYSPQITINVPAPANGVHGLAEQVASLLYERFRRVDAAAARGMMGDQPFPMMGRA